MIRDVNYVKAVYRDAFKLAMSKETYDFISIEIDEHIAERILYDLINHFVYRQKKPLLIEFYTEKLNERTGKEGNATERKDGEGQ